MTKHDNVSQEGIMKATEFVKKFGWDEAKGLIAKHEKCYMPDVFDMWSDELQDFVLCTKYASFDMSDLKRLVESHELVMEFGDDASYLKEHLLRNPTIKEFYLDSWCRTFSVVRLKQAIADVEACQ
ncbi:hypothetical protein [Acinetobacter radioresistens]|uniref:hypothetical protein n=1 Tax=Acinetobacter radioresistens TaxID=40216 RepID=UPI003A807B3E